MHLLLCHLRRSKKHKQSLPGSQSLPTKIRRSLTKLKALKRFSLKKFDSSSDKFFRGLKKDTISSPRFRTNLFSRARYEILYKNNRRAKIMMLIQAFPLSSLNREKNVQIVNNLGAMTKNVKGRIIAYCSIKLLKGIRFWS